MHSNAVQKSICRRPLEVSSKSIELMGQALSAFNLKVLHPSAGKISLESAFQGSKVFERSGHISHAYNMDPRDAKTIAREANSNDSLKGFQWVDRFWPLEPKSWFYDWLYISAVLQSHPEAPNLLRTYDAFTDIEFNPQKSFNCQARSCAIISATADDSELIRFINEPDAMIYDSETRVPDQARLF